VGGRGGGVRVGCGGGGRGGRVGGGISSGRYYSILVVRGRGEGVSTCGYYSSLVIFTNDTLSLSCKVKSWSNEVFEEV